MPLPENSTEDNLGLRRTMRDLVAFSTLPAIWVGLGPEGIARSLADALFNTLSLDLVYVRLTDLTGADCLEVVRSQRPASDSAPIEAVRELLTPLLRTEQTESSGTVDDPFGNGTLQVHSIRIGVTGDFGFLVAGSRNADFPSSAARLLLSVAANQTATVIQQRRTELQLRLSEERLRAVVETTPACIKVVAADGTLLDMNSVGLAMVEADDAQKIIGRSVYGLIAENFHDVYREFHQRICRGEKGTLEFEIVGLQGTRRYMETHAAPLRQADGRLVHLAITHDITERKRVEHELKLQARVLECMAEGVSIADENRTIVYTNPAEDRMFNYEPGELLGRDIGIQNSYPPNENPGLVVDALEQLRVDGVWSGELINRGKDGTTFPTRTRLTALEVSGKRYFVCVREDVTEYKRIQMQLQDAKSRLEGALEAGAIVTWTWYIRSNQIFADGRLAQLFGLPSSEAEGGRLDSFLPFIHSDDLPVVAAALRRSAENGDDYNTDYRVVQPDGSIRWVAARGRVERDETGLPFRMPGVLVEITERKHLEEELRLRLEQLARADRRKSELLASLRESEETLRFLADTIPQLAWMARPDGHIFWYNQRWHEYTGTTPGQMEGWGWQLVHDPETLPKVLERWQQSLASGDPFDMVFPLKGADGQFRPFLTRVNALRDESGEILYWFGTNTDISDIMRMEQALRDADRRKDEFLATLAHELRNPLAPVHNSLQILKMPGVDMATVRRTRDMMERQVHHLVRLVDDLLDVSRVMRGRIELRKSNVELATVVTRAAEMAQPLIEARGHHLEIDLPEESLWVESDAVRLVQVVGNLLTNSAKYTERNGQITAQVRKVGTDAVLRVCDNGIGISPDMLPHVFDLFAQADSTSTKSQGGLGIGLTLVRNLVEMHGGTVQAHSAGLGHGSEFVVRLPLIGREAEKHRQPISSNGECRTQTSASGHRLLIVDDNQDAALSLSMLLQMQGHEVKVAYDGASALEAAREYRPALIFLDLGMPGMDGYEVARRIRRIPGLEKTVLAALSGWGQQEDRRRSTEAGLDHHLVKPPDPSAIESLLAELPK